MRKERSVSQKNKFILLVGLLWACTSEPVKVGSNEVEKPLQDATGVTTADVTSAQNNSPDISNPTGPSTTESKPSLTLDEIYALAVTRTERMAIRQESVIQAEAQKNQAVGSWIPSLSFRDTQSTYFPNNHAKIAREQQQQRQLQAILTGQSLLAASTTSSSTLTTGVPSRALVLHVPIFTGLNEYAGVKAAEPLIQQRRRELFHDAGRFYLEIAQAYFTVLQYESSLKSQEEVLTLSRQNLAQLEYFVSLGKVRRTDLSSARTTIARSEATIQATRDTLSSNRERLATLTGTAPSAILKRDLVWAEPGFTRDQADAVADQRADVEAARAGLEVAKASVTAAWGGHLPSVFVDGYYGLPQHNKTYTKDIYAQLTIQVPIFSGGVTTAKIKEAESAKRQAELSLTQTRRLAALEIRQAYDAWRASREEVIAYKKALDAAHQNYAFQSDYYGRRLVTVLDLLTSLTSLAQAKDDYERAVLQEKLNRIWIGVSVGELPVRRPSSTKG